MNIWRSLTGEVLVELVSASPGQLISAINDRGITLRAISQTGDLSFRVCVQREDFKHLKTLVSKRGETLKVIGRSGIFWTAVQLKNRPVLLTAFLILALLTLYLPTRLLFVQVEGNRLVSEDAITDAAMSAGVGFGAVKRDIRSERVKNALLESIPQLQWVGVNTRGCVAVISVKERDTAEIESTVSTVNSIVAIHDGIVREMTVTRGNPLCKVGQAVKNGQVLVSGYTDCGLTVKAEAAEAEVYADTVRNAVTVTPLQYENRTASGAVSKKFCLLFGKKRINLFKGSGISGTSCVKIYNKYVLTLPGGFQLPVTLMCYTEMAWDCAAEIAAESDLDWVERYTSDYLRGQMLAGSIQTSQQTAQFADGLYIRQGQYACTEMIGQVRTEEIVQFNGKRD